MAALKNPAYFPSQAPPKDGGKSSPANVREKLQVPPTQMHSTLVGQAPLKAQSPPKVGSKPPRANDSPQMGKTAHHSRPGTILPVDFKSSSRHDSVTKFLSYSIYYNDEYPGVYTRAGASI